MQYHNRRIHLKAMNLFFKVSFLIFLIVPLVTGPVMGPVTLALGGIHLPLIARHKINSKGLEECLTVLNETLPEVKTNLAEVKTKLADPETERQIEKFMLYIQNIEVDIKNIKKTQSSGNKVVRRLKYLHKLYWYNAADRKKICQNDLNFVLLIQKLIREDNPNNIEVSGQISFTRRVLEEFNKRVPRNRSLFTQENLRNEEVFRPSNDGTRKEKREENYRLKLLLEGSEIRLDALKIVCDDDEDFAEV